VRSFIQSVFALAVIALALACAPMAMAANEIAYECDLDICLMDPANPSTVQNLTDNGEASFDEKPIWSPDGTKVAFISDFTTKGRGEKNVFVMPASGAEDTINLATQISDFKRDYKVLDDLAWSPDGSRIAFTRGTNSQDDKVLVENADGTSVFPLPIGDETDNRHPTWSPDSSKIAYSVVKGVPQPQVYVASSQGGIGQPLSNGAGLEPDWSPDGSLIAFDAYQHSNFGYVDLHIVNADGSGTPLVVTPSAQTEWTFNAWSPDGGRIAYRSTPSNEQSLYRVMNADGSGDHPLASPGEGDARYASWSPDGSRLVYEGALIGDIGARNLYIANADGSGSAQPLTSNGKSFEPAWRVVTAAPPGQPPAPGQHEQLPPPHPGAKKPKVVWITKRIFVGGNGPIEMTKVFCGAPDCGANSHATARASRAAGIRIRPGLARAGKKSKQVVIGKGKLHLTEGQTKPLLLRLNKVGRAMLEKRGKLTIYATVTIKSTGAPTVTSKHTLHLVLKKNKH
jgi:Tol biopolymer transport system component